MENGAAGVGIQVELDYTKALAALEAFKGMVAKVESDGSSMAGMAAAIQRAGAGLNQTLVGLQAVSAQMEEAAARSRAFGQSQEDSADDVVKGINKQRAAARQQLVDARYLNSTLEQRQRILSRLSAAMTGLRDENGNLSKGSQQILDRTFGQLAQKEYSEGRLTTMANATAELQKQADLQKEMAAAQRAADAAEAARQKEIAAAKNFNNRLELKAIADEQKAAEAAEAARLKAAARADAERQKDLYASKNFNNRLELKAMEDERKQAAAEALATERARKSELDFQALALKKQLATLEQIAAHERASLLAGRGNVTQNADLRKMYSPGALSAYESGSLERVRRQMEAIARVSGGGAQPDTSGTEARRAALRREADQMRDLHSAARGLAGPSGMLWLTYGSMLPIAAGAGLAAGVGSGVRSGGQFAENLAFVRQLSVDTAPSLQVLNDQISTISENLLEMGSNGRFGAVELSQSMRQLSQAGYNANQSQQMLPAVTNLSIIGETDPGTAARAVAGSLSAFNLGADQASRVADVMTLAAARSQTGVAELMESMKQASSVAQDYGATIEETGAVLTLLAQRNIVGSAAGTAFRNMLVDLAGRTPKATKALKELGIEFYDQTTGRARNTVDVLGDAITKLSSMNQQMQNFYAKQIFDERGLRAFSAVAGAGAVNYAGLVDDLRGASANGGFAQRSADQLNTTPIGEYQRAMNALQSSLIQGFNESEDSMTGFARAMREGFQSAEFRNFVSDVSVGVASFLDFLRAAAPVLEVMGKLAIVYGGSRIAMGAAVIATRAFTAAMGGLATIGGVATRSLAAYQLTAALGASATVRMGAAAQAAAIGVRGLGFALGPVAAAASAALLAYELFSSSMEQPIRAVSVDRSTLRSVDQFDYQDMSKSYDRTLQGMMESTRSFQADSVQSLQDVTDQMATGERNLATLRQTIQSQQGADNAVAKQYMLDQEAAFYTKVEDAAARHYGTTQADQDRLVRLYAYLAEQRVRQNDVAMDLMADRAAQAVVEQVEAASKVGFAWADTWEGIKATFADPLGPTTRGFDASEASRQLRVQEQYRGMLAANLKDIEAANGKGLLAGTEKVATARALVSTLGARGVDVSGAQKALDEQKKLSDAATRKVFDDRRAALTGIPANGEKPPVRGGGRVDRSEYNAAKQGVDLAKEELAQYDNMMRIRQRLNLFTSEEQYQRQRDLELSLEARQYESDRAKMVLDMTKAEAEGNAGAVAQMRDNLALLDVQHKNRLQNLELDYESERVQRDINKGLQQVNTVTSARANIMRAMEDMYGSTAQFQTAELSRAAELAAIKKAQYDQAKDMQAMADAPAEVRMLATEERRWELAQQILKIRQEEQRLLFDNAQSLNDVGQSFLNSVEKSIQSLESARTTLADATVSGFASGTQDAWKGLFTYVKNPTQFEQNNNGRSFDIGMALGTVGGAIFDSIGNTLANSLTTSMMQSVRQGLIDAGLVSQADAAREQAQADIAINTKTMADALGVSIPAQLNSIYTALTAGASGSGPALPSNGVTGVAPGTGAALNGSTDGTAQGAVVGVNQLASATADASARMKELQGQSANTFSFMGMNATQTFGLMYMGVNAFATGGVKAFAKFAAGAIAQMLMIYAVQKLIGLAASAAGGAAGGAAGAATAMPVNLSDSITMTPLKDGGVPKFADGTGYVNDKGILMGPGGPREDKIAAMLSAGEGILNAKAVQYYGEETVNLMNKRQLRRFADGGMASPSLGRSGAVSGGNSYNVEINVNTDGEKGQGSGVDDAKKLGQQIETAVLEVFQKHSAQGAQIYTTVKQIAGGQR